MRPARTGRHTPAAVGEANTKPAFIMGHSGQALAFAGDFWKQMTAAPSGWRLHEASGRLSVTHDVSA